MLTNKPYGRQVATFCVYTLFGRYKATDSRRQCPRQRALSTVCANLPIPHRGINLDKKGIQRKEKRGNLTVGRSFATVNMKQMSVS